MPSVSPEIVIPECIFLEIVRLMTWHASSNALLVALTKGDENENVHFAFPRGSLGNLGDYACCGALMKHGKARFKNWRDDVPGHGSKWWRLISAQQTRTNVHEIRVRAQVFHLAQIQAAIKNGLFGDLLCTCSE